MPNEVSATLKEAIYSAGTERVFILLVSIAHSSLANTIYLSSDGTDTVHSGNTYMSFPFDIKLPDDRESNIPSAQFVATATQNIIEAIRTIQGPAAVTMSLVLDSDPSFVERGPWEMELINVSYGGGTIRGTLRPRSLLNEPFPAHVYNTIDYPGL